MLRLLMVAVAVCALSAEAQDGCTQSDCTTSSVRVLPGALPTCNYSRRGTIRQDRDGGLYACGLAADAGSEWNAVAGPNAELWQAGSSSGTITTKLKRQVLLPNDGGVGLPGVAFDGDENTGIAWISADKYSLVTGGTTRFTLDSTGLIGTVGVYATALGFNAATTTNFQLIAFNEIGMYLSGSRAYRFTASGIYGADDSSTLTIGSSAITLSAGSGFIGLNGKLRNTTGSKPLTVEDVDGLASVGVAAASLPTCDATHNGAMQFDTTANKWRVCDSGGASWHYVAQQWTFSGWLPSLTTTTVVSFSETVAAVSGVVYSLHVKPPVGLTDRTGGNVVYTVYDVTSSTVLCSLTIACSAGSGSTTSCTGAVVAGNTLRLRADQSGCTGGTTNSEANVVAGVKGGL